MECEQSASESSPVNPDNNSKWKQEESIVDQVDSLVSVDSIKPDDNSNSEQETAIIDQVVLGTVNPGESSKLEQEDIIVDQVVSETVNHGDKSKLEQQGTIINDDVTGSINPDNVFNSEQDKIIIDQDVSGSISPGDSSKLEEDKIIVDQDQDVLAFVSPGNNSKSDQEKSIVDQVVSSEGVHFKSQQLGEPELDETEKRRIVEDALNRSHSLFLSKFGKHLCREHLEYFNKPTEEEQYEVEYYLGQFRKNLKRKASEMCVKNRRFVALKRLVTEGSYFSEDEMRKRNPLLYEQLVGQYLSEDEHRMRDEIDVTNITLVNLLMEQIDREDLEKLKKTQEEDEDCAKEEEDTSDEDEEENGKICKEAPSKSVTKVTPAEKKVLWGEMINVKKDAPLGKASWIKSTCEVSTKASSSDDITEDERKLLFEEFRTNMFENFLQGKDADFDYSTIDSNPEHDDIETLNRDAEDKYFDSESPETNSVRNMEIDTDDDEFEKFMTQVRSEERTNQITSGIKHLNSDLTHKS